MLSKQLHIAWWLATLYIPGKSFTENYQLPHNIDADFTNVATKLSSKICL